MSVVRPGWVRLGGVRLGGRGGPGLGRVFTFLVVKGERCHNRSFSRRRGGSAKIELSYGRYRMGAACQNRPFLGGGKGRCPKSTLWCWEEEERAKIDLWFGRRGEEGDGSDPSVAFTQAPLLVVPSPLLVGPSVDSFKFQPCDHGSTQNPKKL